MKTLIQTSKVLILSIAVLTAVSYVQAAWSNPTQSPTGGNTAAPINVSSSNQDKTGGLGVLSLVSGIRVSSPEFCLINDDNSTDCITAWPGGDTTNQTEEFYDSGWFEVDIESSTDYGFAHNLSGTPSDVKLWYAIDEENFVQVYGVEKPYHIEGAPIEHYSWGAYVTVNNKNLTIKFPSTEYSNVPPYGLYDATTRKKTGWYRIIASTNKSF